jgi:hypothetical protein
MGIALNGFSAEVMSESMELVVKAIVMANL